MDTKNIIINVFRKNRYPVRFIGVEKSYSYDMYVFEPVVSDAILSDNRTMKIAEDMEPLLGYTPSVDCNFFLNRIGVCTKTESPSALEYTSPALDDERRNDYLYPFAVGECDVDDPVICDFNEHWTILINGKNGYGKSNLIKVMMKSAMEWEKYRMIVADFSSGDYVEDPSYTLIRNKDDFYAMVKNIEDEIKRRRELYKEWRKTKFVPTEEMIESLLPIIVFIDDYTALCTTKKETADFVRFVKLIKRSGWTNCIYLVAAAPLILSTLPDDFVSLFTATFTFKLTDEAGESGRLLDVDNILLPLYYPGDAYYLDNKNEIITRMQCYKL